MKRRSAICVKGGFKGWNGELFCSTYKNFDCPMLMSKSEHIVLTIDFIDLSKTEVPKPTVYRQVALRP